MAIALRCEGCGAALRVREGVKYVSCQACGVGLEIVREGGALFTAIDQELAREGAQVPVAEAAARALSRRPSRPSSIAAGALTVVAGAGAASMGLSFAGGWWLAAGLLVMLVGAGAMVRAIASR
jgi:hypothetical protein